MHDRRRSLGRLSEAGSKEEHCDEQLLEYALTFNEAKGTNERLYRFSEPTDQLFQGRGSLCGGRSLAGINDHCTEKHTKRHV